MLGQSTDAPGADGAHRDAGEQYAPFARKLRELAKGFEERERMAVVEQYIERRR